MQINYLNESTGVEAVFSRIIADYDWDNNLPVLHINLDEVRLKDETLFTLENLPPALLRVLAHKIVNIEDGYVEKASLEKSYIIKFTDEGGVYGVAENGNWGDRASLEYL